MERVGLRNLLSHKGRLALCLLTVAIACAFVSSSFVFADSITTSARALLAVPPADLTVRPAQVSTTLDNASQQRLTPTQVAALRRIPGVSATDPEVQVGGLGVLGADAQPLGTNGVPVFGISRPQLVDGRDPLVLAAGREPTGADEVALDAGLLDEGGWRLGSRVRIVTPTGSRTVTVVGSARPMQDGVVAGSPVVVFPAATAAEVLLGSAGANVVGLTVTDPAQRQTVATSARSLVGSTFAVADAAESQRLNARQSNANLQGATLSVAVLAGIALMVGMVLIGTTFSMVVKRRTQELALLRAVGATRGQVRRSVAFEAALIGFAGAVVGIVLGLGLGSSVYRTFPGLGSSLPDTGVVLRPRTIVFTLVVGVLATIVASWRAAGRAARATPVEALADNETIRFSLTGRRFTVAIALLLMSLVSYYLAATTTGSLGIVWVVFGAVFALITVVVGAPLVIRGALAPMGRLLGTSPVVRLGTENSRRSPRRTSATVTSLMLAMMVAVIASILVSSGSTSLTLAVRQQYGNADLVVRAAFGQLGSSSAATVRAVSGVGSVYRLRTLQGTVGIGATVQVSGTDPGTLTDTLGARVLAGDLDSVYAAGATKVAVSNDLASTSGLAVGSTFPVRTGAGTTNVVVGAIVTNSPLVSGVVCGMTEFARLGGGTTDNRLLVRLSPGATAAGVTQGIQSALHAQAVLVQDQTQLVAAQQKAVGQFRTAGFVVVGIALLIALVGVINALAISVLERGRELGVLRAVGATETQVRRMVVVESVLVATFGAVLGLVVGLASALAVVHSLHATTFPQADVPWLLIVAAFVLVVAVAAAASLVPARRAARTDILTAISVA